MEVVKVDDQGRLIVPKPLWEMKGLTGELELLETEEGVLLRPRRTRG